MNNQEQIETVESRWFWETVPNRDIMVIHHRERFPVAYLEAGWNRHDGKRLNHAQRMLLVRIFKVNGIKNVHFYPYEISIEKGLIFDWDELKAKINIYLAEYFDGKYA